MIVNKKEIELYTIQMAKWRIAKQHGIEFIDVTAKSGNQVFAPDRELVYKYKTGLITENYYTEQYHERMFLSQIHKTDEWIKLINLNKIAIACYCPADHFCHRHILKYLIKSFLAAFNCEVICCGEITNDFTLMPASVN